MLLSRSLRRKLLATALTAAAILLLYEATVIDSRQAGSAPSRTVTVGAKLDFVATAYCKGQTTRSGVTVQSGIVASDPKMLPEGSVVQLDGVPDRHAGIYTVLDTGPKVQGRHVDVYMWSCHDALAFGRRPITLTVLRLGWNPKNTVSGLKKSE